MARSESGQSCTTAATDGGLTDHQDVSVTVR
jgi:hypothetical protein